jgi:hypothetical protein
LNVFFPKIYSRLYIHIKWLGYYFSLGGLDTEIIIIIKKEQCKGLDVADLKTFDCKYVETRLWKTKNVIEYPSPTIIKVITFHTLRRQLNVTIMLKSHREYKMFMS